MKTALYEQAKVLTRDDLIADIRRRMRGMPVGDYFVTAPRGPSGPWYQAGRYAVVRRRRGWDICSWNAGHGKWCCGNWYSIDPYNAANNGRPAFQTAVECAEALVEYLKEE